MMLRGRIPGRFGSLRDDVRIADYVGRINAGTGVYVGAGLAFLEAVLLVAALARRSIQFSSGKVTSYVVLGVMSAVLCVLSRRRLRDTCNNHLFIRYLTGYLVVAAVYGVHNSLEDFAQGKQIITFLLVMMMDACIFATPPVGVLTLTLVSYVTMFVLGLSQDRMDVGSQVNFWLSWVVITTAGFLRYRECRVGAYNERTLQHVGEHDGLTGLRNRMALRADFPRLCLRDQYVVMCDLDDFKVTNDTFGHAAGDAVLVAYADALREAFPDAVHYRYGGDEFLLFVPAQPSFDLREQIALLRRCIAHVHLDDGQTIEVSTSLGWTRGVARDEDDLRNLIREADANLYEAKHRHKFEQTQADS